MGRRTGRDIAQARRLPHDRAAGAGLASFARLGVDGLPRLVPSELATLASFVLNRSGRDFSDAERDLLDVAGTWLSALYRNMMALDRALRTIEAMRCELADRSIGAAFPDPAMLTAREREVLRWVGAGKSNAQIAAILGTSPRTVQKHLEHVYVKLGVENRLAAVMRAGRDPMRPSAAAVARRGTRSRATRAPRR